MSSGTWSAFPGSWWRRTPIAWWNSVLHPATRTRTAPVAYCRDRTVWPAAPPASGQLCWMLASHPLRNPCFVLAVSAAWCWSPVSWNVVRNHVMCTHNVQVVWSMRIVVGVPVRDSMAMAFVLRVHWSIDRSIRRVPHVISSTAPGAMIRD